MTVDANPSHQTIAELSNTNICGDVWKFVKTKNVKIN